MTVHNFSTQYNTEQFWWSPLLHPDNHHSSDVVYRRKRGQELVGANYTKYEKNI